MGFTLLNSIEEGISRLKPEVTGIYRVYLKRLV